MQNHGAKLRRYLYSKSRHQHSTTSVQVTFHRSMVARTSLHSFFEPAHCVSLCTPIMIGATGGTSNLVNANGNCLSACRLRQDLHHLGFLETNRSTWSTMPSTIAFAGTTSIQHFPPVLMSPFVILKVVVQARATNSSYLLDRHGSDQP